MTRRFALALVLTIVLANAGVTCLYSGTGPTADSGLNQQKPWNRALEAIAELLTAPLPTAGSADIRDVVLPAALGLVLLMMAWRSLRPLPTAPTKHPAETWLLRVAIGVTVLAVLSALLNQSFDLSWGWIVRWAAGACWAIVLARVASPDMTKQVIVGLLIVAVVSLLLSFAYRADRGLAYFIWPIGPVTITGALATVWAAMAAGLVAAPGLSRVMAASRALAAAAGIIAIYALEETGRRAPALGLVFAALFVAALLVRLRFPGRRVNVLIAGSAVLALGAAAFYFAAQLRSGATEKSGPVALRLEYWRLSAGLVGKHPLLGIGPDMLIVDLTNTVAPLRAEAPRFYHGNIDPSAHNEWLQAAVELGVPGGLLYLALPIGVMFFAVRRLLRPATPPKDPSAPPGADVTEHSIRAMIVALIAGLIALIILDSASITMRGPMMPIWYWTMLGLLAALCRGGAPADEHRLPVAPPKGADRKHRKSRTPAAEGFGPRPGAALACFAAAMALLIISGRDLSRAVAETRDTPRPEVHRLERLWAEKTLSAERGNAMLALRAAMERPEPANINAAVSLCKELYRRLPGQPEVAAHYANALLVANQKDEARRVLEDALGPRCDPFNAVANVLYAQAVATDPVERLRCVQRAIRSAAVDDMLMAVIAEILRSPVARAALESDLPQARQVAGGPLDQTAAGATVELLRISAADREQTGRRTDAIADQRLAAEYYRRLDQTQSRYRRRFEAEYDAFYGLARLLYQSDPPDYPGACAAIVTAEQYAVLGIKHEAVAQPKPEEGFVGGEVIPTEFPENLRPLWQLSSLLHVLAGDERHLMERVLSGMPTGRLSNADVQRELARIYRQACADLTRLPPAARPGHYAAVCDNARQFETSVPPSPTR